MKTCKPSLRRSVTPIIIEIRLALTASAHVDRQMKAALSSLLAILCLRLLRNSSTIVLLPNTSESSIFLNALEPMALYLPPSSPSSFSLLSRSGIAWLDNEPNCLWTADVRPGLDVTEGVDLNAEPK